MKIRIAFSIATLMLGGVMSAHATTKPAALVKAAKGPIQIIASLRKTKVGVGDYLWYKITLKNVGKTKLRMSDMIFKNVWAMHENSQKKMGIYLEVIAPDGALLDPRMGGGRVTYDWESSPDGTYMFNPEEKKEVDALYADWRRRGFSKQQQTEAFSEWNMKFHRKKNLVEMRDPAKQLWLNPGASTTTIAWVDRGPGEYEGRADDDKALLAGYTQLWSYQFLEPGKYRVRVIYDHEHPGSEKELVDDAGRPLFPQWVKFATPYISIEVRP